MRSAYDIRVRGVVQGVGFRPFVYRLAHENTLAGWVLNDEDGVEIHLEGAQPALIAFVHSLSADRPLAAIIQAIDPIYVYFDVSETDLLRFMAMLRNNELPDPDKNRPMLHLGLANEEGFPHEGHLDFRELGINAETGTARRRGDNVSSARQTTALAINGDSGSERVCCGAGPERRSSRRRS